MTLLCATTASRSVQPVSIDSSRVLRAETPYSGANPSQTQLLSECGALRSFMQAPNRMPGALQINCRRAIPMKVARKTASSPRLNLNQNQFLAALSEQTWERLAPNIETVALPLNEVVYQSGDVKRHVYFPTIRSWHCCMFWKTGTLPRPQSSATMGSPASRRSSALKATAATRSY